MMRTKLRRLVVAALVVAGLYVSAVSLWFRFEHPCMTETQLFMNLHHALALRSLASSQACK
jgi:hypothetical protein